MHSQHEQLLNTLFQCLNARDPLGSANCYHQNATFQDIAFTLSGKKQIQAMWDFICSPDEKGTPADIQAIVLDLSADESTGRATVVDIYTFRKHKRRVANLIESSFTFEGDKIISQVDHCDSVCWARQAIGGFAGFVAGHVGFVRRGQAMKTLRSARPAAFQ